MATANATTRAGEALRRLALGYPEVREDFPWGERALKVNKKVFLFLRYGAGQLSLSLKLPSSQGTALMFPFAQPTGYGLGKAGWVTAQFERGSRPPLPLLKAWLDESYHAVAPKRLAAKVPGRVPSASRLPKKPLPRRKANS